MVTIKKATLDDWDAIERIYREGIRTKLATFTTEDEIGDRESWFEGKVMVIKAILEGDSSTLRLGSGITVGWASLSPVSSRCVYRGVAEDSVYVSASARGKGVGDALLSHLITASEADGFWTLQASTFPENIPSVRLHQKHGFRIVGTREKISQLDGEWRDTVFLERRSEKF